MNTAVIEALTIILNGKLKRMKIGQSFVLNSLCGNLLDGLYALDKVSEPLERSDSGVNVIVTKCRKKKPDEVIVVDIFDAITKKKVVASASQIFNRMKDKRNMSKCYIESILMCIEDVSFYISRGSKMFYRINKKAAE